jgi:hypothetical protein
MPRQQIAFLASLSLSRAGDTQVYSADLTFRRNCLQHDSPSIGHEI